MSAAGVRVRAIARAHRALLVVLVAGAVLRAVIVWSAADLPLRIVDEQHYKELAESLYAGRGFANAYGPTSIRPPLYPMFIAAVWTVTGTTSLADVRIVQALLSLVTVCLLYALALRLFDRRVAVLAAAGLCFYPSLVYSNVLILTETLFTLLLVAAVAGYASLVERPRLRAACATGVALGLAALTRSVLWPFAVPIAVLVYAATRGSHVRRLGLAAALLAGFAIVVAPWAIRNTQLQGTVTIVDTMGGLNLRMGNYEFTPIDRMWDAVALTGDRNWAAALRREHPDASTWSEGRKEKWAQANAIAFIREHPILTVQRDVVKFADFWGLERELAGGIREGSYAPSWTDVATLPLMAISYVLVVGLGAIGVFVTPPANRRVHWLLLLLVVGICGVHTIVFGHSRYHLPLIPILLLYAASAARADLSMLARHPARLAGPALAVTALLAIWLRELLIVDRGRIVELLRAIT